MKLRTKILAVLIVVAALVLLMVFRQGSSKRAVESYKQQLRAQGEKLLVAELLPTPPPESLDGAQTFLGAMSLSHQPSNIPPTMKLIRPGRAMVAWQQEILPEDKISNIWPGLSLELKANRDTLSSLQSALNVPVLYFNLDYSQGWGTLLPHLAKLKQAEILTSVSAVAALHERKFSEAWTNLHDAVILVRRYQAEPLTISHLVHIAMAHIAIAASWEFLQSDQWTDAQLAELQSNWQAMEFFDASESSFVMERAMTIGAFQLARTSYDQLMTMASSGPTVSPSAEFFDDPAKTLENLYSRYLYWGWKSSWSYDEELLSLENCEATLKAIHRTELSGAFAPALKELDGNIAQLNKLHTNAASHFMFGDQNSWRSKSLLKFADAEVSRRLLITAIALKRYQLRLGKYPADLKTLIPEFLNKVPQDLMDGQPLRYKPAPDGNFLLYSVGEDGEDNGGDATPTEPASTKSKVWFRARDAVWPRPATAEEVAAYFKTNSPVAPRVPLPVRRVIKETNAPAATNGAAK